MTFLFAAQETPEKEITGHVHRSDQSRPRLQRLPEPSVAHRARRRRCRQGERRADDAEHLGMHHDYGDEGPVALGVERSLYGLGVIPMHFAEWRASQ